MHVEFQIVLAGKTVFTLPFKVKKERQLAGNLKQAMDAFCEEHADISLLAEDVIMLWRRVGSG